MKLALAGAVWLVVTAGVSGCQHSLPAYDWNERDCAAFEKPRQVTIEGYSDDAMEPCISPDGHYLYFNNSNAEAAATHLHVAERLGADRFVYRGKLQSTISPSKDMAPSLDRHGVMYFTSLRQYDKDRQSLFQAPVKGSVSGAVACVPGAISPAAPGWVNMDCGISEDGQELVISRARFEPGWPQPVESDLLLAGKVDGAFQLDGRSSDVLHKLNTGALEYAPHLSGDRLRLYFTRCGISQDAAGKRTARSNLMLAVRKSAAEQFGEPVRLACGSGFVEAPSLPADETEIFFHKLVSGKYVIMRAPASSPADNREVKRD